MPGSSQRRTLNYNAEDLFNLVLDIENYPEFIPYCSASRIISKNNNKIVADLVIRYKFFNDTFRSYVEYDIKNLIISVKYSEGPLKSLYTNWKFNKLSKDKTLIIFDIEVNFKFNLLNKFLKNFYNYIENKLIVNFEKRADKILGNKI